ncbi:hypothetical protein BG74_03295 [Sodalis-like endosymbiont of Proechinophthirus fluctus]|nr:hypothetical protein BG74_03295 [Sodalis-like endosymbiont of Proechinophthirus fluctus]
MGFVAVLSVDAASELFPGNYIPTGRNLSAGRYGNLSFTFEDETRVSLVAVTAIAVVAVGEVVQADKPLTVDG